MINIVIGQFYDGCQIYKTKHSSFWPLVVSFLNLPPSYRTKMGVGMLKKKQIKPPHMKKFE